MQCLQCYYYCKWYMVCTKYLKRVKNAHSTVKKLLHFWRMKSIQPIGNFFEKRFSSSTYSIFLQWPPLYVIEFSFYLKKPSESMESEWIRDVFWLCHKKRPLLIQKFKLINFFLRNWLHFFLLYFRIQLAKKDIEPSLQLIIGALWDLF